MMKPTICFCAILYLCRWILFIYYTLLLLYGQICTVYISSIFTHLSVANSLCCVALLVISPSLYAVFFSCQKILRNSSLLPDSGFLRLNIADFVFLEAVCSAWWMMSFWQIQYWAELRIRFRLGVENLWCFISFVMKQIRLDYSNFYFLKMSNAFPFSVQSRAELDKLNGSLAVAWRTAVSSIRPIALVRTGRHPFNNVSNIRVRQNHRQLHRLQHSRHLRHNNHPQLQYSQLAPFRRLLWLWLVSVHSQ